MRVEPPFGPGCFLQRRGAPQMGQGEYDPGSVAAFPCAWPTESHRGVTEFFDPASVAVI